MKALLEKYGKRLDAYTRRERVMILAAGTAVILALFYLLGIAPALERGKLMAARIADQKNQIVASVAQTAGLERTLKQDPDVVMRQRIAEMSKQITEIDTQLASLQRTLVPPESMGTVLEQLVGRDLQVRIVRLRNLAPTPLVEKEGQAPSSGVSQAPAPGSSQAQAQAQAQAGNRHVYKHGVQVLVEGSYLELLAYVARLEKQPWQVYWGRTVMIADYPKVQVELTLYTLSLDKAWLVV
jgi:MSHA biogenesis protein MshJ